MQIAPGPRQVEKAAEREVTGSPDFLLRGSCAAQDTNAEQTLCPIIVPLIDTIGSPAYMAVACFTMHYSLIVCQYLAVILLCLLLLLLALCWIAGVTVALQQLDD